ncbi:retrovirus-related Pol polyprotein from transposon 17.6 [Trichonephila clavipes]|nr:retrovirus-related Pol polyprotein from transposon 17.6 [Trichonephila clavipes]
MSDGQILHIYKYGRKTELHTDACKQGYGAILLQEAEDGKLHHVYYMSKKTNTAEEKYDSYELEKLAIINALKRLRVYLLRQHFKIVTDCSAFQKTMQKKDLITRIARWVLQLEEFDYEIKHRAGSRMKHVDALSRYPVMMVCNDTLTSKLKKAQEEDNNIQTLK